MSQQPCLVWSRLPDNVKQQIRADIDLLLQEVFHDHVRTHPAASPEQASPDLCPAIESGTSIEPPRKSRPAVCAA